MASGGTKCSDCFKFSGGKRNPPFVYHPIEQAVKESAACQVLAPLQLEPNVLDDIDT
jgi:hypothetical protein